MNKKLALIILTIISIKLSAAVVIQTTPTAKNNCTGTLAVTIDGDGGPFTIQVNGPGGYNYTLASSSEVINELCKGFYTITVTNDFGCETVYRESIEECALEAIVKTEDDKDCTGDGKIVVEVVGSSNYSLSLGAHPLDPDGKTYSGLSAGSYTLVVMDAETCTFQQEIEIFNNGGKVKSTIRNTCMGSENGEIHVFVLDPEATISWDDGPSTEFDRENLAAGTYTANIVTKDCSIPQVFMVESLDETTLSVSGEVLTNQCGGLHSGSILATPIGGASPFTYEWSNGTKNQTLDGVSAGSYTVTITDQCGNSEEETFTIQDLGPGYDLIAMVTTTKTCTLRNEGSAQINTTGGTGPYQVTWRDNYVGSLGVLYIQALTMYG